MIEKKHYSVLVSGIPEHERLILKLIFSVSQKAKSCVNSYALIGAGQQVQADILIVGGLKAQDVGASPDMSSKATVIVVDRTPPYDGNTYLARPLVATRVLSLLDKVVERLNATDVSAISSENRSHTAGEALSGNENPEPGADSSSDTSNIFDFDISEDDAYRLAVVQDEALANPANREYGYPAPAASENSHAQPITLDNPPGEISAQTVVGESIEAGGTEISDALSDSRSSDSVAVSATGDSNTGDAYGCATDTSDTIPEARRKALVVDDSASVRKQLELELALFDVDVDYAANAGEALALLNERRYDVAFLDVVLPDMDGFQICKSIKSTNKNTAVVMLTAKSSPADKVRGSLAGCDAYLVKPVGRQTFQNTTLKYLTMSGCTYAMHG